MTTRQMLLRGNESARKDITPAVGELIATLDTQQVYLGDGSTPGGNPLHPLNLVNAKILDHSSAASVGSLAWWIVRAAGEETTLHLAKGIYPVNADMTVPVNMTLRFDRGAVLAPQAGATLTMQGGIEAGPWRIFGDQGTVLGGGSEKVLFPEWFGAVGDGVADDTDAWSRVLGMARSCQVATLHATGTYGISRPLGGWRKEGDPTGTTLLVHGQSQGALVWIGSSFGHWMLRLDMNNPKLVSVEGMSFLCRGKVATGLAVTGNEHGVLKVERCVVMDPFQGMAISTAAHGIYVQQGDLIEVRGCRVENVRRAKLSDTEPVVGPADCKGIHAGCASRVVVENNLVRGVYQPSSDPDSVDAKNADGIAVFSLNNGELGYREESTSISGNTIIDCEGRWLKLQTNGRCDISRNIFRLETASLCLIKNWRGVDPQVAGCSVFENDFYINRKGASDSGGSAALIVFPMPAEQNIIMDSQSFSYSFRDNQVFGECDSGKYVFPYAFLFLYGNYAVKQPSVLIDISGNKIRSNFDDVYNTSSCFATSLLYFSNVPASVDDIKGTIAIKLNGNHYSTYYTFSCSALRLIKQSGESDSDWYARINTAGNRKVFDFSSKLYFEFTKNRGVRNTPSGSGSVFNFGSTDRVFPFTSHVLVFGNSGSYVCAGPWNYPLDAMQVVHGSEIYLGAFRLKQTASGSPVIGTYHVLRRPHHSLTAFVLEASNGTRYIYDGTTWRKQEAVTL